MTAEEWADAGLAKLYEEIADLEFPIDQETAGQCIRAAYAHGYQDSLVATEPPIVLEALRLNEELALRIPVL